ncbi:hypothetical protein OC188_01680 [Anaplasma capra]|uniref:Cpg1 family polymorphic protein n=1 Tax=Anaplasma capra TaxID=1562740 RepID=UPI0021D5DD8F|nr:hypothetical protein [Anaplasma capra]MCU7611408.1 hypothetical protein [Anaplasma capra]
MPKRLIDATEQALIALLQKTMEEHKPWKGVKGQLAQKLREITIPKPQDAHSLSIFVTEDYLLKIASGYTDAHVGSPFMNVLSLADEEVREHYIRPGPGRSPAFARILIEFRNALKSGVIDGSLSDLSTFTDFLEELVAKSRGEITYDYVKVDPVDGSLTEDVSPLERAMITADPKRNKNAKPKAATLASYGTASSTKEDAAKSAVEILIGQDYRILSPDWLLMRSLAIAYIIARRQKGLEVEERCPDNEELVNMFNQERKCAALLYGCVLLSTYVEEIRQAAVKAFEAANPKLSKLLKVCRKVASVSNITLGIYLSFMVASMIATSIGTGGAAPAAVTAGTVLGWSGAAVALATQIPQLSLLASQGIKNVGEALGLTSAAGIEAAALPATAAAATAATTAAAGGAEGFAKLAAQFADTAVEFASPVAVPATLISTAMMYISFPRVMFGGYESSWIRKYIEASGDEKEFKPPSMWSPLIASMGIKLIMNTMLGATPHIKCSALTAALGWSLYRLYLPLSLIEQPSKVRNAYEVAIAATSRRDNSDFTYNNKVSILCCFAALGVELALHAAGFHMPSAASMALNFLMKTARIGAWIGPVIHARLHGQVQYTREFEKMFWTDGVKAITAPAILLLFEIASGQPALSTGVLAGDILVSLIPDLILGSRFGALNVASGKIVALESLMKTGLSQQAIIELSVAMAMQEEPSVAQERLQTILEKHFGKDQYKDLGIDLTVDGGLKSLSLEAERKWRTIVENTAHDAEEDISTDKIAELIEELGGVFRNEEQKPAKKKGGSAGKAEKTEEEVILDALEAQHPFLALWNKKLTDAQNRALEISTAKFAQLSAEEQKKSQEAIDKFEDEYFDRLIASMTDEQRGAMLGMLKRAEELGDQAIPGLNSVNDKKIKSSVSSAVKASISNLKQKITGWDRNRDPFANSDIRDLAKNLDTPEGRSTFLGFLESSETFSNPFGLSPFDQQFASTCSGRTSGHTRQDVTSRGAAGVSGAAKHAGDTGGASASTPEPGSKKPSDQWDSLVKAILEEDDAARAEALAALLRSPPEEDPVLKEEEAEEVFNKLHKGEASLSQVRQQLSKKTAGGTQQRGKGRARSAAQKDEDTLSISDLAVDAPPPGASGGSARPMRGLASAGETFLSQLAQGGTQPGDGAVEFSDSAAAAEQALRNLFANADSEDMTRFVEKTQRALSDLVGQTTLEDDDTGIDEFIESTEQAWSELNGSEQAPDEGVPATKPTQSRAASKPAQRNVQKQTAAARKAAAPGPGSVGAGTGSGTAGSRSHPKGNAKASTPKFDAGHGTSAGGAQKSYQETFIVGSGSDGITKSRVAASSTAGGRPRTQQATSTGAQTATKSGTAGGARPKTQGATRATPASEIHGMRITNASGSMTIREAWKIVGEYTRQQ